MRINYVLPRSLNVPMGGYKVVFQYARELGKLGYDVHIYFSTNVSMKQVGYWKQWLKGHLSAKKFRQVTWFDFGDSNVKLHFDQSREQIKRINEGKIIATHWSTVDVVRESKCDDKFYFLQDYEIFDPNVDEKKLNKTWDELTINIVISTWLLDKAAELGVRGKTHLLSNFIDTGEFPIVSSGENNKRNAISFLWHNNPRKQSEMGIQIANKLKDMYPELEIMMFGVDIPNSLDNVDRFRIYNNASIKELRKIYKQSMVYFMPSNKEGWGLTGMEAMACGAAVVSVDNGGIWEYADQKSAVIVDNDVDQLFNAIVDLLEHPKKREQLVTNAYQRVTELTLAKQTKKLVQILSENKGV